MPFLSADVIVRVVGVEYFDLVDELVYEGRDDHGQEHRFAVPAAFHTDFASVPRPFLWLLPRYGVYTRAAILHDYLCDHPDLINRARADGIFREAMRELEVPFARRWAMWAAVRLASRLRGIGFKEFWQFLAVMIQASLFLLIPTVVIVVWLGLFWLVETVIFVILRLFAWLNIIVHRPPRRPKFGATATK